MIACIKTLFKRLSISGSKGKIKGHNEGVHISGDNNTTQINLNQERNHQLEAIKKKFAYACREYAYESFSSIQIQQEKAHLVENRSDVFYEARKEYLKCLHECKDYAVSIDEIAIIERGGIESGIRNGLHKPGQLRWDNVDYRKMKAFWAEYEEKLKTVKQLNISCQPYGKSYHLSCQNMGNKNIEILRTWEGKYDPMEFTEPVKRCELIPLVNKKYPIELIKEATETFLVVGANSDRPKLFQGCVTIEFRREDKDYPVKKHFSISL
ncbi:MAG: hypothetical protein OXE77_00520 [Flavobacteriaceae bacterium]|nr:hypothetical protein [Flavobacteriaceae bacterium]